jgi:hypothetical protein
MKMKPRHFRNRRAFRLESLEIRNAPSNVGGLAHVALAMHHVHAAAHVRHFSDSQARDKVNSVDRGPGVEQSPDKGVETKSSDPRSTDTSPNDRSSVDRSGVEQTPDKGVETKSSDPSGIDTSPNDPSSVDPANQN